MLTQRQLDLCLATVSPNTFYTIVLDALTSNKPLSITRMGDGERLLMDQCLKAKPSDRVVPPPGLTEAWLKGLGIEGITAGDLLKRLNTAAESSTYFAPSISGITDDRFNVHQFWPYRKSYVDNFFVNAWSWDQKTVLFKKAGHVLLIHRNPHTADSMQLRVQANLGVKVNFIKLDNWKETADVIEHAHENTAPLVLFSGGPGGKYIAPQIAQEGRVNKVVLDIGNGADHWTFDHLPIDRPKAEAFHKQWAATHS